MADILDIDNKIISPENTSTEEVTDIIVDDVSSNSNNVKTYIGVIIIVATVGLIIWNWDYIYSLYNSYNNQGSGGTGGEDLIDLSSKQNTPINSPTNSHYHSPISKYFNNPDSPISPLSDTSSSSSSSSSTITVRAPTPPTPNAN